VPGIGPVTAAALLAGGAHLEQLVSSGLLATPRCRAASQHWEKLVTWRNMISLDQRVPLPRNAVTGAATTAMPRAAEILERLRLW
jgi:DNA polymerase-1